MKQKLLKQFRDILFVAVLMICMMAATTMTVFAAPGDSAGNPVDCDTFAEFKAAMEDPDVIYVKLLPTNEILPVLDEGWLVPAIAVTGEKDLYLANGGSMFWASAGGGVYDSLLQVGVGSSLNIDGTGTLSFKAVGTSAHNAVIYNQGGDVRIEEGYLEGEYNTATYGKVIWQESGTLNILDGSFCS